MLTKAEIARNALKTLREDGWYKGGPRHYSGSVCINTAISMADTLRHDNPIAGTVNGDADELAEQLFPERMNVPADACGFLRRCARLNDHPDTVFEDVEIVLEKLAIRYEELGE